MSIEISEDAAVFLKDGGDPVGAVRHEDQPVETRSSYLSKTLASSACP